MSFDASVSVANFSDHFESELKKIGTLRVWFRGIDHTSSSRVYRKILYATALDTLSRVAFPDIDYHRQRVLVFIDRYTGWDDRNRISLPQLWLSIKDTVENNGILHTEIERRMAGWSEGTIIRPDRDPVRDEMMHVAETASERKAIEATRYAALFYTYRNHLVHEFREPGYGIERDDDSAAPYYHSMTSYNRGSSENSWELVFPCRLFRDLCRDGLRALVKELKESDRSPHASFRLGTLWQQRQLGKQL